MESLLEAEQEVENIIQFIRGTTGNNFQNNVGIILTEYYKFFSKKFVMPEALGGDYKNDGWVEEDALFYMMYSPIAPSISLTQTIKNKFKSDIEGLFMVVYNEKKWKSEIKKVIFIINMIDRRLPPDPDNYYENICNELSKQYNIKFQFEIWNVDKISNLIEELPIEVLCKISLKLHIVRNIDFNMPTATDLLYVISKISKYSHEALINKKTIEYNRISTIKKIEINNLSAINQEIISIIERLGLVDELISELSQDIKEYNKFLKVKEFIIDCYFDKSRFLNGVDLYKSIIEEMAALFENNDTYIYPIKFLIIYIFDHCEIFKKESEIL